MLDKTFENTIRFYEAQTPNGTVWFPIITATLVQPDGNRVDLPLMFDTGASAMTLRHDLHFLLGVPSWDSGQRLDSLTAGSDAPVSCYRYQATFEFLGKTVQCPVHLQKMPAHPLWVGLFGREQIFKEFGFGFWESTHELYVSLNP